MASDRWTQRRAQTDTPFIASRSQEKGGEQSITLLVGDAGLVGKREWCNGSEPVEDCWDQRLKKFVP